MFYNSLACNRTNIVRIHVNVAKVEVKDPYGIVIPSQVDPFFVDNEVSSNTFKVCMCLICLNTIQYVGGLVPGLQRKRNG